MHATKKISCLRQDVALERYEVDAHDIAEAMLRRLAPVNWGRIPAIAEAVEAEAPRSARCRVSSGHRAGEPRQQLGQRRAADLAQLVIGARIG